MLASQRDELRSALRGAIVAAGFEALLPDDLVIALEPTRQSSHGDVACNIAMQLARKAGKPPRELAALVVEALLRDSPPLLANAEIAGPGFINLWLTPAARHAVVATIVEGALQGRPFGDRERLDGAPRTLLEFVSANPTGPLHVGHGRQALLGDALASLLESQGVPVSREFYYNDAGAQIANLALSVQARLKGIQPDDPEFPADGYRGDYIAEIARAYREGETVQATIEGDDVQTAVRAGAGTDDLDAIRRFAVAYLRREQDLDLEAFGVRFDRYFLESSLYSAGRVDDVVSAITRNGHAFEADGALWLRSTDFGDDKDRVMRKSDGTFTYFVPDVAYHVTKFERGFGRAINIQGWDHHGTTTRVRAGLQALERGIPVNYPEYVLHKMVRVMRNAKEVKISKRAGSYVTLRDLIEWSGGGDPVRGRDAVRYFLATRKGDTEFTFDVDLALARSNDNPVYYVQYAHARICRILVSSTRDDGNPDAVTDWPEAIRAVTQQARNAPLQQLQSSVDFQLIARLAAFPTALAEGAADLSPHPLPYYLKELAAQFHAYYDAQRVLVDDPQDRSARLALLVATRLCLSRGLELLGVSSPERM